MSNGLQTLDAQQIGELPTEEEAQLAETGANLPPEMDTLQISERATFGRFRAKDVVGVTIAGGYMDDFFLERAKRKIDKDLQDSKNPALDASLADALKNLVNASVGNRMMTLKAVEALSYGKQKEKKQSNAPTEITGMKFENVENLQVVTAPSPEKAA